MKAYFIAVLITVLSAQAQAALIEAEFSFDGTTLTQKSGDNIWGADLEIDAESYDFHVLKLTFSASEGSYWDFSAINNYRGGFGFLMTEAASRGTDGPYEFLYNGETVYSVNYYYNSEYSDKIGPYSIDMKTVDLFDTFIITYHIRNSIADTNILADLESNLASNTIWSTLTNSSNFVAPSTDVTEPNTIAIAFLALAGLIIRRKFKS